MINVIGRTYRGGIMLSEGVPINFCPACGEQLEYDILEINDSLHEMLVCWNTDTCTSKYGDIVVKKVVE